MTTSNIHRRVAVLVGAAIFGLGAAAVPALASADTTAAHPAATVARAQTPTPEYCKKHPADPMCKDQK